MAVSQEQFQQLADQVRAQEETIATLRANLDEAGRRVLDMQSNQKRSDTNSKYKHIQLAKDLCPEAYTGKDVSMFNDWKLKVSNYLSRFDDDMTNEILEWAGNQKETITPSDYNVKATAEVWDFEDEHMRFSRILYKFLEAKTCDKANRLVQNGELGDGVDAWRRLVFAYDPQLASQAQNILKSILSIPRAKDTSEAAADARRAHSSV